MTIGSVLLDIAGVIHDGEQPIPGSLGAISRLRDAHIPLRFITNTTRSTKRTILTKLRDIGLDVADGELFTPTQAALDWLAKYNCSAVPLVHSALASEFAGLEGRPHRAVVVGDAGDGFNYTNINSAFREILAGATLIALAKNRAFKDSDGHLSIDAGAFVSALEYASGQKAIVVGKPAPEFFKSVLASIPCRPEEAIMVGDDAEADVAGALRCGLGVAILVRTGKYRPGDEERYTPAPSKTFANLVAVADWILTQQDGD